MSTRKVTKWSAPDAHRIAGITYQQLDYWIRSDIIKPTVPANGTGNRRRFSWRDLVAVRAIAALKETGVSLRAARKVQSALVKFEGDDDALRAGRLIIESGTKRPDVAIASSDAEVLSLLKRPGQVQARTVFEMAAVVNDVRAAVSSIADSRSKAERERRAS